MHSRTSTLAVLPTLSGTATERLLNLHGEMAHVPVVLAAYAGIRQATDEHGTFDLPTRAAIMLSVSCAERNEYAIAVNSRHAEAR